MGRISSKDHHRANREGIHGLAMVVHGCRTAITFGQRASQEIVYYDRADPGQQSDLSLGVLPHFADLWDKGFAATTRPELTTFATTSISPSHRVLHPLTLLLKAIAMSETLDALAPRVSRSLLRNCRAVVRVQQWMDGTAEASPSMRAQGSRRALS